MKAKENRKFSNFHFGRKENKKKVIGIDVGGSKILGVLFDCDTGKILREVKVKTELKSGKFVEQIKEITGELINGEDIDKVGIGMPGILDREKTKVIRMPNIPDVKNLDFAKTLGKKFGVDVKIENDAKCHAIGEHFYGGAKGGKNFIVLAMGTGLGGGIFVDGKLYRGRGSAGEFGHIGICVNGEKCNCGSRGCLEMYASGKAVKRYAREIKIKTYDPKEIENLARGGNKKAKEIYEKVGKYLGAGLSSLIVSFDPEVVVITGSISNASDLFLPNALEEVRNRVFFSPGKVMVSRLNGSGAIGAASLFRMKN